MWYSQDPERQVFPDLSDLRPSHGITLPRIHQMDIHASCKYSLKEWLGPFLHVWTCKTGSGGALCFDVHLAICQRIVTPTLIC